MDKLFENLLEHEDYEVLVGGIKIHARHGVFSPDTNLTHSTSILIKHLPDVRNKRIIDMGCGTGIIAITCALQGAEHVIASDVSNNAIQNTKENIQRYNLEKLIDLRKSNLFESIPEKFDYILANLPILDEVWNDKEGEASNLIKKFVLEAIKHLELDGSLYFAWGSFSDITPLKEWLSHQNLQMKEISEEALGYQWTLFEIRTDS